MIEAMTRTGLEGRTVVVTGWMTDDLVEQVRGIVPLGRVSAP